MSRKLTSLGVRLVWLLAACDGGALDSHRVQVPAKLAFTVQPTAAIAGAAIRPAIAVTVQDAHGNTVTGASTKVTVALGNNRTGGALSGTVTLDASNGVAIFSDLSLDKSGTGYTLTAVATHLSGGVTSSPFNVSLAPRTLGFELQPSTTAAGHPIAPAVTVAVLDEEGNTVESASTSVTLGIGTNPSGATLAGTPTTVVVNGVARFSNLIIDNPGTGYTRSASAIGLNGASSAAFNVSGGFAAVSAGSLRTCGLTAEGAAYWWGLFLFGDSMDDSASISSKEPVAVGGGLTFATVSCGNWHTCARTISGAAYCWGPNSFGELGNGQTVSSAAGSRTPVAVAGGLTFAAVSAGGSHSCGVTTTGAAYCWGANYTGQLGNGSTTNGNTPVAVVGGLIFTAVSAGNDYNCGVTTAGAAYCWGANYNGQLGNGSTTDSSTPVPVAGGLDFAAVSAGSTIDVDPRGFQDTVSEHTCGLTPAGAAYCWGGNSAGQLGNGSTTDSSTPVAVAGELTFAMVSAGGGSSCGVTSSGAAYCWGANDYGQLGNGSTKKSSTPAAVAGGLTFATVASGPWAHTCGVTRVALPYCWGRNDFGQLGIGSTTDSPTPVRITSP